MDTVATTALAAVLTVARVNKPPSLTGEAGWTTAGTAGLPWDFTSGRPAPESTRVRVLFDERYLYVRFDAQQRAPVVATQNVDDVGQGTDDNVHVSIWPGGSGGFQYTFDANPRGTHYQSSSENATYAPTWTSAGTVRPDGYSVTMRIPLAALRANGQTNWSAQFTRTVKNAGETYVWSYKPGQPLADGVAYAGRLEGLGAGATRAARTRPRFGVYALGEAGTPQTGGTTSRTGLDLAIPVTPTSSFVATLHPDFSNVEIDQQTIAPTTFRRQYAEVRPFFAQGANFYDYRTCYACPAAAELYTPAIPTPRRGYQLEGKQGSLSFGALDAVGDGRVDGAQSVAYLSPSNAIKADYTRVTSDQTSGVHDVVDYGSFSYNDQKRFAVYAEGGVERGSTVIDVRQAQRYNAGVAYQPKDTLVSFSLSRVGAQYNPVDGFVAVGDIAGYNAEVSHNWRFTGGPVQFVSAAVYTDRYAGSDGFGTNLADTSVSGSVFFRNRLSLLASAGSSYYRVPGDPELHSQNQQGLRVDYKVNTALQSTVAWNAGRFGNGYLTSPQYQAGFRIARGATVSLLALGTSWRGDAAPAPLVQWLERGSVTFDLGPRASFVAGARKIVGTPPAFPGFGSPRPINATNLSFGFAARRPHDELYLVYGDASALQTRPALTLKVVHYVGAEKGT